MKGRYMYCVRWHDVQGEWLVHRIDREEAYTLALTGHAIQAFDTREEAFRELSAIRSRNEH